MMRKRRRRFGNFVAALAIAVAAALPGCSKQETVKLVPAQGFIKVNGKPVANIMVQCLPDALRGAKGPTSSGISDEDGWFKLMTLDGKEGAVVGPCKIVLADLEEDRPAQGERAEFPPRIPATYSVVGPHGLSGEVKEDGEPIEIDVRGG
jgi:hypothetical protein